MLTVLAAGGLARHWTEQRGRSVMLELALALVLDGVVESIRLQCVVLGVVGHCVGLLEVLPIMRFQTTVLLDLCASMLCLELFQIQMGTTAVSGGDQLPLGLPDSFS